MANEPWRKPRALRRGDRVAIVAPASPCAREAVINGVAELEGWGLDENWEAACEALESAVVLKYLLLSLISGVW